MELCFLLSPHRDRHRCSSLFAPTGHCCILPVGLSLNCSSLPSRCLLCLVCFSPKLHLCVAFWFHLLVFSFSKTPSRHSHTRTDPTSPRSATETETIQERCVSLQTAAFHLCPLTSVLLFALLTLSVAARPRLYSRNDIILVL